MVIEMMPPDIRELWVVLEDTKTFPSIESAMREIVKHIILHPPELPVIDIILLRCARQQQLFELGMCIVMLASAPTRRVFRDRLVESGAFLMAIRLANGMNRMLSREEVLTLGSRLPEKILKEDREIFLRVAEREVDGMLEIDLLRLRKQLQTRTY